MILLLDTCPIPPFEAMLSRLQVVLALLKCHSTVNVADMVGVGHSMQR